MNMPVSDSVMILCSGFGLGFYIPGLLIGEKLQRMGIRTDLDVFESLLPPTKIQMVEKNRQAYHESFRVALASQKVPSDTRDSLDPAALKSLLARWQRQDCRHLICLSGHWVHVLDLYREIYSDRTISADLLYLDADLSPSWRWLRKLKPDYAAGYREVRLYDDDLLEVRYCIDMNTDPPLPHDARERRLVVHGGGWGIGTFQQCIPNLESAGYGLDVVCYVKSEANSCSASRRNFMDDPNWRTWHRNRAGKHAFPPFGEIISSELVTFASQTQCNGLHRIIRSALGIVSKPGAGTLIDSFGSATPIIMLEPFGPHEARNAQVWLASGFGVPYQDWADAGYPASMLEELHLNLLSRRHEVKDFAEDYAEKLLVTH
jgi:hypothetical protein